MSESRETFSALVDRDLLDAAREMARDEGKDLETVVEEALREHVGRRGRSQGRDHVMRAFRESLTSFDSLYDRLAK